MNKNGQNEFTTIPQVKLKIKVVKELCVSAATCIINASKTFDLDEESIAFVKEGSSDDAKSVIRAAMSCPTSAIIVEDLEGNRVWPENG